MLDIEPSGHTVHIQQFSDDMETGYQPAFHRRQIDLPEGHATGRDEFLAEGSATADPITTAPQGRDQVLLLTPGKIRPAFLRPHPSLLQQVLPETPAQLRPRSPVDEQASGLLAAGNGEGLLQLLLRTAAAPVDPQTTPIARPMQATGRKGREPQHRRTTQAPVGDQDRALLAETLHRR